MFFRSYGFKVSFDQSNSPQVSVSLPEYGVLFYRVVHEKRPVEGEIILGVCAKGIIIYEVKDGSRSTSQTFFWPETSTISSNVSLSEMFICRKYLSFCVIFLDPLDIYVE